MDAPLTHSGVDPEDWDVVLGKVEVSYEIKFHDNELAHVRTMGELLSAIDGKIIGSDCDDCTTRQAFYWIRQVLAVQLDIDPVRISPNVLLESLIPRRGRRTVIRSAERIIGTPFHVFRLKPWIPTLLWCLFIGALLLFFWSTRIAFWGLLLSCSCSWVAWRTTLELKSMTVGQLADALSRRAYKRMRRDRGTINRKEVRTKLRTFFQEELGLEERLVQDEVLL